MTTFSSRKASSSLGRFRNREIFRYAVGQFVAHEFCVQLHFCLEIAGRCLDTDSRLIGLGLDGDSVLPSTIRLASSKIPSALAASASSD